MLIACLLLLSGAAVAYSDNYVEVSGLISEFSVGSFLSLGIHITTNSKTMQ